MTTDNILAPVAALTLPDQALLIGGAQRMLAFIDGYAIESNDDFGLAADELKTIKAKQKTLEDQRTAITGPLNAATKAVNDLFRGPAELLTRAEGALKAKMLTWQRKVEAEAAEARRVAEEAARAQREAAEAEARKLAEVAQVQAAEAVLAFNAAITGRGAVAGRGKAGLTIHLGLVAAFQKPREGRRLVAPFRRFRLAGVPRCGLDAHGAQGQKRDGSMTETAGQGGSNHRVRNLAESQCPHDAVLRAAVP